MSTLAVAAGIKVIVGVLCCIRYLVCVLPVVDDRQLAPCGERVHSASRKQSICCKLNQQRNIFCIT